MRYNNLLPSFDKVLVEISTLQLITPHSCNFSQWWSVQRQSSRGLVSLISLGLKSEKTWTKVDLVLSWWNRFESNLEGPRSQPRFPVFWQRQANFFLKVLKSSRCCELRCVWKRNQTATQITDPSPRGRVTWIFSVFDCFFLTVAKKSEGHPSFSLITIHAISFLFQL